MRAPTGCTTSRRGSPTSRTTTTRCSPACVAPATRCTTCGCGRRSTAGSASTRSTSKADWVPYPGGCDLIESAYGKLVGANLVDGFRKTLYEALGGVHGCTHITELLSYLPTAAVQTFAGLTREDAGERKPFQLDRCHALETSSETVRRYYPKWYRGAA